MNDKLDPTLRSIADNPPSLEASRELQVIVALSGEADDETIKLLKSCGMSTRSVIGSIVTGSISVENLTNLAGCESVVKVEGSGPLYLE